MDARKAGTVVTQAERGTEAAGAHHLVAGQRHDNPDIKGRAVRAALEVFLPTCCYSRMKIEKKRYNHTVTNAIFYLIYILNF